MVTTFTNTHEVLINFKASHHTEMVCQTFILEQSKNSTATSVSEQSVNSAVTSVSEESMNSAVTSGCEQSMDSAVTSGWEQSMNSTAYYFLILLEQHSSFWLWTVNEDTLQLLEGNSPWTSHQLLFENTLWRACKHQMNSSGEKWRASSLLTDLFLASIL